MRMRFSRVEERQLPKANGVNAKYTEDTPDTVDLRTSIGVALHPAHGQAADALLRRAEVAMYAAKRRQLGVVVYEAALDSSSEASLSLLGELRTALERDHLARVVRTERDGLAHVVCPAVERDTVAHVLRTALR